MRDAIPVTTVDRTIADLRRSLPAPIVRRAIRQADYMNMLVDRSISDSTRSDLERAFLALCRRHRIPEPEVNIRIGRYTVDFYWRNHGLVIETDGYAAHRGRQAFRDDRDRDLELATKGIRVHRIADMRIAEDPDGVATLVRRLLKLAEGGA